MGFKALISALPIQQNCLVLPIWSKESIAHGGHWTGIVYRNCASTTPIASHQWQLLLTVYHELWISPSNMYKPSTILLRNSPNSNHRGSHLIRGLWNWKPILLTIPFHSSVNFDIHSVGSTILRLLYPDKHTEDGTRRLLKSSEKRGLSRWGYLAQ